MASFEIIVGTPVMLPELKKVVDNIEGLGYKAGAIISKAGGVLSIQFTIPDATK